MGKSRRNSGKSKGRPASGSPAPEARLETAAAHQSPIAPPAKNPSLLAISVFLFAGWFVYLLIVALRG
jgi:hypothetical protein